MNATALFAATATPVAFAPTRLPGQGRAAGASVAPAAAGAAGLEWADTLPALFRSEAFAEDLLDSEAHASTRPSPASAGSAGTLWQRWFGR